MNKPCGGISDKSLKVAPKLPPNISKKRLSRLFLTTPWITFLQILEDQKVMGKQQKYLKK